MHLLLAAAVSIIIANAGENVTRENGSVVCTLNRNLVAGDVLTGAWCGNWQIVQPAPEVWPSDPVGSRWIMAGPAGVMGPAGLQLHVGTTWRGNQ